MTSKVEVDCNDMKRCYKWPYEPWISSCRVHMGRCDSCRIKYSPYFRAIDDDLSRGIKTLSGAIKSFYILAKQCGQDGEPGAAGALAINAVNQVMDDFKIYMDSYPNHNISALIWLQKAFVICRFFEAQHFCQDNLSEEERQKVGEMRTSRGERFETVTSLSYLMKNHDEYSTFEFNFDLHKQIIDLLGWRTL